MPKIDNAALNAIFLSMRKRAERFSSEQLVNTFVNAGLLMEVLGNEDHQIVYGRRGTGKTHAFGYLAEQIEKHGGVPLYIDISRLGSDTSIYNDVNLSIPERAVRLLRDVLNEIHDQLLSQITFKEGINLERFSDLIDTFGRVMPSVEIQGVSEVEATDTSDNAKTLSANGTVAASSLAARLSYDKSDKQTLVLREKKTGARRYSVRFPDVGAAIAGIADFLSPRRIWVLIDEWSSLPQDIQPFLADMLRKSFFNVQTLTVKIAAIEHRSQFYAAELNGQYIGFELGADISSSLNLDDYLVFDNDVKSSTQFFANLFQRHVQSIALSRGIDAPPTSHDLVNNAFTSDWTFNELVRASEGVPRDAINILASAAQKANSKPISIPNLRQAARTFYQTDKSNVVDANPVLGKLLSFIIETVIGDRKTSIFLLEAGQTDDNINRLFDMRILHVKSRNGSSRDHRGKRFLVYKIDYGCYIDLVYTKNYPKDIDLSSDFDGGSIDDTEETLTGEVEGDAETGSIEVPLDDKRSYRRAVLDLGKFYQSIDTTMTSSTAPPNEIEPRQFSFPAT